MIEINYYGLGDLFPEGLEEWQEYLNEDEQSIQVISVDGKILSVQKDGIPPEDAYYFRSLSWIEDVVAKVHKLGYELGLQDCCND